MKKSLIYVLTVCLLAGAALVSPNHAQTDNAKAPSSSEAKDTKAVRIPFSGKLSGIDKAALSITLDGKVKKRIIRLTPETKIVKAGKPATLEDAVIGDEVGGQLVKNSEGQEEAISLRLGAKPEGEPKPRKRGQEDQPKNK